MGFIEKDSLRYYQFESFKDLPVFHAILTRRGGVSQPPYDSLNTGGTVGDDPHAVLANHVHIFDTLGYDFDSRFDAWQVHGDRILCAKEPRGNDVPHPKADGILTDKRGVTLLMRFADCVPILLVDPIAPAVGIVHAGWKGTYQQIAQRAVEKMCACFGSKPENIYAGIGPSICQRCYQVGSEVVDLFSTHFGEDAQRYFFQQEERYFLDLWLTNRDILHQTGVRQIETSGICTACHVEDWFSHRAEAGRTGRFAVLMSIADN